MSKLQKVYKSESESEGLVYIDLKAFLSDNKIEKDLMYTVLLTVSEAFTNALVHGNKYDSNKSIQIFLEVNKDQIVADIIDEGNGAIKAINSRKPSEYYNEGGRGIDLISHYADKMALLNDEKTGGLHLRLNFNLSRCSETV